MCEEQLKRWIAKLKRMGDFDHTHARFQLSELWDAKRILNDWQRSYVQDRRKHRGVFNVRQLNKINEIHQEVFKYEGTR